MPAPRSTTFRRIAAATLIATALLALITGLPWQAEARGKGTLLIECPDDSLAVEVFSEKHDLLTRDDRPKFQSWGLPPPGTCAGRCVFFRKAEPGRWEVFLAPGTYTVATHRASPCGFWGGDTYRTVEVTTGDHLALTLTSR